MRAHFYSESKGTSVCGVACRQLPSAVPHWGALKGVVGALLCVRAGGPGSAGRAGAGAWPLFLHPRIQSTRALEHFRNQARAPLLSS